MPLPLLLLKDNYPPDAFAPIARREVLEKLFEINLSNAWPEPPSPFIIHPTCVRDEPVVGRDGHGRAPASPPAGRQSGEQYTFTHITEQNFIPTSANLNTPEYNLDLYIRFEHTPISDEFLSYVDSLSRKYYHPKHFENPALAIPSH